MSARPASEARQGLGSDPELLGVQPKGLAHILAAHSVHKDTKQLLPGVHLLKVLFQTLLLPEETRLDT